MRTEKSQQRITTDKQAEQQEIQEGLRLKRSQLLM
jgi:hypothetical protein